MIGWIIFLIYAEFFSAGLAIFCKRTGEPRYLFCLIPFAAFFFIDKMTGGFKILSIKVEKWGRTVIWLTVISLAAFLYAVWGNNNLNELNAMYLMQIMWVPIGACLLIFYLGIINSALAVMNNRGARFKGDVLLSLLFVSVPFILMRKN